MAAEEIMLPPKLVRDGSQQVLGSQHSRKAQSEDSGICFQGEDYQKPKKCFSDTSSPEMHPRLNCTVVHKLFLVI